MNCGVASVEREAPVIREASPLCFPEKASKVDPIVLKA